MNKILFNGTAFILLAMLSACGGGGGSSDGAASSSMGSSSSTPVPTYNVTGMVNGLSGSGLTLTSGTASLAVTATGPRTLATMLPNGTSYNIVVSAQPTSPSQTCTVNNGSGTVSGADVTNIVIACVTNTYTVGGVVTGLAAATNVVLQNNAGGDLTVSSNAVFSFATAVVSGSAYSVTIKTQPTAPVQVCTVTGGSGTVTNADVPNVNVACVTAPLLVTSTDPSNNAIDAARTVHPVVHFSTALNPSTVTTTNFTLQSAAGNVPIDAFISPAKTDVALNPKASRLLPLTQYTLTTTGGVRGWFGEALANTVTTQFTTRDGAWGTAALIETDDAGSAGNEKIAFDTNGNAFAVWAQSDGTRNNIWTNRYSIASGWGTATLIETDNIGSADAPQIAMDANGNALAVWSQSDGTRNNIWSNRYATNAGWGTATPIEGDNAGNGYNPQIAVDANGNALAVWHQSDGTRYNIWSNRYTANAGWGTATLIEGDNSGSAINAQIVVDAVGNALAVWRQSDGTRYNIWSNRYTTNAGWGTATLIETDNTGHADSPCIATDANGNALAVWDQSDGTRYNIWSNRYSAGSGWGTAVQIETDNAGSAYSSQIAFDVHGNALTVWSQSDGTRYNIWSNRYSANSGWGVAVQIETDNAVSGFGPRVAIDANGNALAVWYQSISAVSGSLSDIWSNRYSVANGWGTPVQVETGGLGHADWPQIAIDANGSALALWTNDDGIHASIWSSRFE